MSAAVDWAARVLETDEDILVPVKKLWTEYSARVPGIARTDFTRELEQDARFEFAKGTERAEEMRELDMPEEEMREYETEMEAAGFFHGPRVKLKGREITSEDIAAMLKKHTDRMMENLWQAYDVRPVDMGEDADQELLDLIVRAKEFQLKAQELIRPDDHERKD